jgi:hypothetical protein
MSKPLFCTYCSARKNKQRKRIYALRRYDSSRLKSVFDESRRRGAAFAILSGRYGLIGPYKKIPRYDHLLKQGEIAGLLPQMVDYLTGKGYDTVYFFHESTRRFPQIKPYCEAIKRACRLAQSRLHMKTLSSTR